MSTFHNGIIARNVAFLANRVIPPTTEAVMHRVGIIKELYLCLEISLELQGFGENIKDLIDCISIF